MSRPGPGSSLGIATTPALLAAVASADIGSDAASSRLSMVITGLIALAVIITVSTVFFWRATRPDRAGRGELDIRWIQPEAAATRWSTSPTPSDSSTAAAAPPPEAPAAEIGSLRPRPADG